MKLLSLAFCICRIIGSTIVAEVASALEHQTVNSGKLMARNPSYIFRKVQDGKADLETIPGYRSVKYHWRDHPRNPRRKAPIILDASPIDPLPSESPPDKPLIIVPKNGFLEKHTGRFQENFKKSDPVDKVLMIANTISPLINILPKSELRNNTKKAISMFQAAQLIKDVVLHESKRNDPVMILKRVTWAIMPTFDMMPHSPTKVAIAGFVMGANALHTLSTGQESFQKLNEIDKIRKLADDFLGNMADILPDGDLKNSMYLFHRGIHTAAFFQNRNKIGMLDQPGSDSTLRALSNVFKFLPDGDTRSSLRSIIAGLRAIALIKNPW